MAEPLKNFFNTELIRNISAMLRAVAPAFPEQRFITEASEGLGPRELLERARHIAAAMRRALPDDFERAAELLRASLGPELDRTEDFGMAPFLYLPHVLFVA